MVKRLIKRILPKGLVAPILPVYHYLRAVLANVLYLFPARKLKVIGVTGTNGKTTVIRYLAEIYKAAEFKVGYATSIDTVIDDKVLTVEKSSSISPTTTRDPFTLQKLMRKMKRAKVDVVILEVTSHALAQYRTLGIPIETAVLTNISPDHLDYHKTMDRYVAAKTKLFKKAKQMAVVNGDDEYSGVFAKAAKEIRVVAFGESKQLDVRLEGLKEESLSTIVKIGYESERINAKLGLSGKFNALNALAAAATALASGIEDDAVKAGLENLKVIPGRMEKVDTKSDFGLFIDYAHTPEAFEQVFTSVKNTAEGRIIAVFGGAAQHDYAGLGEQAGKFADVIVVTDDEPENVDPEHIRKTIIERATSSAKGSLEIHEIPNRREGIKKAITEAKKGDVILLLCLGHQTYRRVGDKKVIWNDREEAVKVLQEVKEADEAE